MATSLHRFKRSNELTMKKSPKILIIDDEAPIRASLKEILEYENYQVMEAEDGAEGLKLATKFAFDVVFCDIKMPKMDGLEVLDALVEKGIDGRVIMISGHSTVETAVQAIKVGAFDFIQKPLDLNRILLTVRHALLEQPGGLVGVLDSLGDDIEVQ